MPGSVTRCPKVVETYDIRKERDYIDLALFVSMSECGFFIWDTCLTLGLAPWLQELWDKSFKPRVTCNLPTASAKHAKTRPAGPRKEGRHASTRTAM